jgi:YVTN family beta-propeller protein
MTSTKRNPVRGVQRKRVSGCGAKASREMPQKDGLGVSFTGGNMRLLLKTLVLATAVLTPVFGQYLEGAIDVGEYQADILCNPLSNRIYASNHLANTVTIIDGTTRQIIAIKTVPSEPWYLQLNTVSNRVYCLCWSSTRLAIINGVTDSVKRLTIPHGGASAFAYNAVSNRLYVGCDDDDGHLAVVDGAGDTILYEVDLGVSLSIANMFWNPVSNYLFCTVGQDSVFVLDCRTDEVCARWNIAPFDEWCYSPATGRVYAGYSNRLWVFSPRGDSMLATINRGASNLCAVPFPDEVYIEDTWIYVLDGSTSVITDTIPISGGAMVCDTSKGKVYAAGGLVFDARADSLLVTIPLPAFNPQSLCWNPTDGRVYVADQQGDSVYVLRDTTNGVAESGAGRYQRVTATLVRRCYSWSGAGTGLVMDVSGRMVAELQPGANDVGCLPAGVYTVVQALGHDAQSRKDSGHVPLTARFVKLD